MIFSTDRCPLCNKKLRLDIRDTMKGKVVFHYYCETKEIVRNDSATADILKPHYDNESYTGGCLSSMIIPPFQLFHSQSNDMTSVYKLDARPLSSKKLIFRTKLLDLDYSRPHIVLSKLKLLVTFS